MANAMFSGNMINKRSKTAARERERATTGDFSLTPTTSSTKTSKQRSTSFTNPLHQFTDFVRRKLSTNQEQKLVFDDLQEKS